LNDPDASSISMTAAQESITLLKNRDSILPLTGTESVLLAGPAVDSKTFVHGSWSYTWQGMEHDAYPDSNTLKDVFRQHHGPLTVVDWDEHQDPDRMRALAHGSDIVVLALGEVPSVEKPGDIQSLEFPEDQLALVRTVAESGATVVVVLFQNRPRIIRELEPYAEAIVLAYQPGPNGPAAVFDVLHGAVNPSGHLPFTYPRYSGSLVPYDYKWSERADILFGQNAFNPQYEFGFGLSYTTFEYSDLAVVTDDFAETGTIQISVTLSNVGEKAGKEVVQLYSRDEYASITPSNRRLRSFQKVELAAGESVTIRFDMTSDDLSFVGKDNSFVFESGEFTFMIDDLSETVELSR